MIFKKKELGFDLDSDWENALETEIYQYISDHNFGKISDEEFAEWQKNVTKRIHDIRDAIIRRQHDEARC